MRKIFISSTVKVLGEVFLYISLYIYFFSGIPFLPQEYKDFFGQQPSLLRMIIMAFTLLSFSYYFFLYVQLKGDHSKISFTGAFLSKIKWNFKVLLWFLYFSASLLWASSSIIRHLSLHTSFDMAIFTQAIWNTTQGEFLFSSIKGGICLLGDHFAPLLAVYAVPYFVFPHPNTILIMQSLAAAACVFPIYKLAEKSTGKKSLALIFAFAFLNYNH